MKHVLTPDTFRYLTTTGLLGGNRIDDASAFLLESRLLAVPALHLPATLWDELYLRAASPLLAVAVVVALAWFVRSGLHRLGKPVTATSFAVLAGLWLLSMNRFVFNAFYLNGHLALAAWLLVLGGVSWMAIRCHDEPTVRRLWILQLLVLPAIVLSRPEAGLVALIVVLPSLVAGGLSGVFRWVPLGGLGASMVIWQGFLASRYWSADGTLRASVWGLFVLGIVLVGVAVLAWRQGERLWLPRRALGLAEVGLWALLGVLVVLDPRILLSSARATAINVLAMGGWGVSFAVLASLVIAVIVLTRAPGRTVLRFPLTAFVPLAALLAYLREGAYRVGPGDSLNRMLIHLVPLAILFVVTAVESERWGVSGVGTDGARSRRW